jgi:hypothetical protein
MIRTTQTIVAACALLLPSLVHAEEVVALMCSPVHVERVSVHVKGEVRNDTGRILDHVSVLGNFRDASGKFVSMGENIVRLLPLLPGQASPFDFYGDEDEHPPYAITSVTIAVSEHYKQVPSSGMTRADCGGLKGAKTIQ